MKKLTNIRALNPELRPPNGSRPFGVTSDGRQLYELTRMRSRSVPKLDDNGNQLWAKNPMTAEPLYPKRRPELYEETLVFYLESQGNGNVSMVRYRPPTPEQVAEDLRRQKVAAMGGGKLGEAMVDADLTPDELMQLIRGKRGAIGAGPEPEPVPESVWPSKAGGGYWDFSNGERKQMRREQAIEYEASLPAEVHEAVDEAKANAALTPEV